VVVANGAPALKNEAACGKGPRMVGDSREDRLFPTSPGTGPLAEGSPELLKVIPVFLCTSWCSTSEIAAPHNEQCNSLKIRSL
jgi:hypothetical protein